MIDYKNVKILVAEDDNDSYQFIKVVLNNNNFNKIYRANNGLEVLDLNSKNEFGLIIMDITMPYMDGIEATQKIKKIAENIPIVILTAIILEKTKLKAFEAGCDYYLTKPLKAAKLIEIVNQAIRN